jgi:hypothetical protein
LATLSFILRAILTGLGRFLVSIALIQACLDHWSDCWSVHTYMSVAPFSLIDLLGVAVVLSDSHNAPFPCCLRIWSSSTCLRLS